LLPPTRKSFPRIWPIEIKISLPAASYLLALLCIFFESHGWFAFERNNFIHLSLSVPIMMVNNDLALNMTRVIAGYMQAKFDQKRKRGCHPSPFSIGLGFVPFARIRPCSLSSGGPSATRIGPRRQMAKLLVNIHRPWQWRLVQLYIPRNTACT